MKNVLVQYLWIFSITLGLLTVALLILPEKKEQPKVVKRKRKCLVGQKK